MYEHNALGYLSGLALCLTKVRSSRARCPATALIVSTVCKNKTHKNSKRLLQNKIAHAVVLLFCYTLVLRTTSMRCNETTMELHVHLFDRL